MSREFQFKAVQSTRLESSGHRLDCSPYLSGAIEIRDLLAKLKNENLDCLTIGHNGGIYSGPRFAHRYVTDSAQGVRFLTPSNMLQADLTNLPMISAEDAHSNKLRFLQVEEGTTLIPRSGDIRRMAFARKDMMDCWTSQYIMKVVADPAKIHPGYLHAFLSCRFGIPLLLSGVHGTVIRELEASYIASIPVPRLGKKIEYAAHNLIQEAADLRCDANIQVAKATSEYDSAAGLGDISTIEENKKSKDLGFTVMFPDNNNLMAADFLSIDESLELFVKHAKKWVSLGDLTEPETLRAVGRFSKIESEPGASIGVELLNQNGCFSCRPEGKWILKKNISNEKLAFLPDGSIVIAGGGGVANRNYFGRCQFVAGKRTQYAYSENFIRIIPKKEMILPGCLFAFLRSKITYRLLHGYATGKIIKHHDIEKIKLLPIPLLDQNIASHINDIVIDAYRKYEKATDCENKAHSLVEGAIDERCLSRTNNQHLSADMQSHLSVC